MFKIFIVKFIYLILATSLALPGILGIVFSSSRPSSAGLKALFWSGYAGATKTTICLACGKLTQEWSPIPIRSPWALPGMISECRAWALYDYLVYLPPFIHLPKRISFHMSILAACIHDLSMGIGQKKLTLLPQYKKIWSLSVINGILVEFMRFLLWCLLLLYLPIIIPYSLSRHCTFAVVSIMW